MFFYVVVQSILVPSQSVDAIEWIYQNSVFDRPIKEVCYGNGIYVAVGVDGRLATSLDAVNWEQQETPINNNTIDAIVYNNGMFVIGSNGGRIAVDLLGFQLPNIPNAYIKALE